MCVLRALARRTDGGFEDALLRAYAAVATDLGLFQDDHLGFADAAAADTDAPFFRLAASQPTKPPPYNLLLTRGFLVAVRRDRRAGVGVDVNALAFAGCLLAPDTQALEQLIQRGPLSVLAKVAAPAEPS